MAETPSRPGTCLTARGRPAFVVNVEVFLHRDGRFLLVKRGEREGNAPGLLGGVGGKVEPGLAGLDVFEQTARRETLEEVGVDLTGVELAYVGSGCFVTDDGDPVVNVVFSAPMPAGARPVAASPEEVAGLVWLSLAEAQAHPGCPAWTIDNMRAASSPRAAT